MERLLGLVGQLITLMSATAFLLAVIYQWGYFLPIDVSFLSFLSVQDYFVGAIVALPPLMVSVGTGVIIGAYVGRYARAREAIADLRMRIAEREGFAAAGSAIAVLLFFLLVPFFALPVLIFPIMVTYYSVVDSLIFNTKSETLKAALANQASSVMIVVSLIPLFAAFTFLMGLSNSYIDGIRSPTITIFNDDKSPGQSVILVRKIGEGLIYRLRDHNAVILETDNGSKQYIALTRPFSYNSWSCIIFGWPCLGGR